MSAHLNIAVFTDSTDLVPELGQFLAAERYTLQYFTNRSAFLAHVEAADRELDCLVFDTEQDLLPAIEYLYERGLILPVVLIRDAKSLTATETVDADALTIPHRYIYQPSEVVLAATHLSEIGEAIDRAISKFLSLTPIMPTTEAARPVEIEISIPEPDFLLQQQRRLADKLKERLGYLAVYYKRNPRQFFRYLDSQQKEELLSQLKSQYRKVVLEYFTNSNDVNDRIDELVSVAFFSDISVSEIVKIHMELMEEFANQLKLEGRSEEILLDYRLTLIDTIAHLCELYRRSIPREI